MNWRSFTVAYSLICLLSLAATAQDKAPQKDEGKAKAKPPVKVTGYFEPVGAHELTAGTKEVKSLVIKKIVPHGTRVKKGEAIVWFDTEAVDKQVSDAENALRLAELAQQESAFDYQQFLAIQKLDRAVASRTKRDAQRAYDNFVKVDRDRNVASAEFNLKSSRASLENALEELRQLEKMYKEDELTEESEEIVLKRAKRSVEGAQFRLKSSEILTERTLTQSIPGEQETQDDTLARAMLAYDKAIRSLDLARQRRDIEVAQSKKAFAKKRTDMEALRNDRKQLVLRAPADGIVYHGKLIRGRLGEKPSGLAADVTVTNNQVLVTLVNPAALQIRVDLPETALQRVQVGGSGTATPRAFADRKLPVTVKSVSQVPQSNGKHDCVLSVKLGKQQPAVMPGMSCEVELK
ncbi:MAG TPA: HlyD family secretion protein [Planctomycetaceae bacterium]|nr:HlyD family secretion protein [Blastopirellula sp.]HAY81278.1 HlyD family secretion protein [Planctomycetaceae bacterium]